MTIREKIENMKKDIQTAGYDSIESFNSYEVKLGTMYLKEKMDYGFHIYFIHEPSDSNPLAGKYGTLTEMYYDLRNRVYWIKRNLKDVQFSVRNVDSVFGLFSNTGDMFDFLSTENNQGLYASAFLHLGAMQEERTHMFGRFFHRLITEHSYYELLHKAGIRLGRGMKIVKKDGTSPREILGLSKTQWKISSKYKIDINFLQGKNNDEADRKLINLLAYVSSLSEEFGIDKVSNFASLEAGYLYSGHAWRSALQTAKEYGLPEKKLIRYLYFECDVSQGLDSRNAIHQYDDYIRMCTEMEYERFDRYPKFLRTMHDVVARNYNVRLDEVQEKLWKKRTEDNMKFKYSYGGYKIFPPTDPKDLIKEGNVLSHCVASYVGKVTRGDSTILFLRDGKDEDHPLVTIEVVGNRISQARGKMNNPPTEDQKDIIKKFANKFELSYN